MNYSKKILLLFLIVFIWFRVSKNNKSGGGKFYHQLNPVTCQRSRISSYKKLYPTPLSIRFMKPPLMAKIMKQKHQKYLFRFAPLESKLRKCSEEKKRLECYQSNLLYFTSSEKEWLNNLLTEKIPIIFQKFPRAPLVHWNLVKFQELESNMPHTFDRYIMISQSILDNWIKNDQRSSAIETLLHEKIHVDQRLFSRNYHILYRHYWKFHYGYQLDGQIKNHPVLHRYQRVNPDGMNLSWIFVNSKSDWVLPIALLKKNATSIREVEIYAIPIDKKNSQLSTQSQWTLLSEYPDFVNFFGPQTNLYYHPNEISAVMIPKILLDLDFKQYPGFKRLMYWCYRYWS